MSATPKTSKQIRKERSYRNSDAVPSSKKSFRSIFQNLHHVHVGNHGKSPDLCCAWVHRYQVLSVKMREVPWRKPKENHEKGWKVEVL